MAGTPGELPRKVEALAGPFLAAAKHDPDSVWACTLARERTRGASRARVARLTADLLALGAAPGSLLAFASAAGPNLIEGLIAAWHAHLVPVLIDARLPAVEEERVARALGIPLRWRIPDGWAEDFPPARLATGPGQSATRLPAACVVKLTSGSSGTPRGVVVSAEALLADAWTLIRAMGLGVDERMLAAIPLTHSYGFSVLASPALVLGATLLFPDGEELLGVAEALGASFLPSVPAWYQAITRREEARVPAGLRLFLSAGAPLSPAVAGRFRARFGRPIHVLYGASECGGITYDRDGLAAEHGRVGTPLEGVEVRLKGPENGCGTVVVRSRAVASGYVPACEEDGRRLGAGRYVSEDLARFVEGQLELRGRRSDWLKVKGQKVDPREVEGVIADLPGVREVAVVNGSDERGLGSGALPAAADGSLRAVIACTEGDLSYLEVLSWCRPRLAPHKLPRSIVFVRELPRSERGKLDREALRSLRASDPRAGAVRPPS